MSMAYRAGLLVGGVRGSMHEALLIGLLFQTGMYSKYFCTHQMCITEVFACSQLC